MSSLLALPHIAEYRSLNQAAQSLHTSQPALTRQIKSLERSVGAPIFHRSAQGMTLAAIGELLVAHAEAAAAELRQVSSQATLLASRRTPPVRLGIAIQTRGFLTRPEAEGLDPLQVDPARAPGQALQMDRRRVPPEGARPSLAVRSNLVTLER